MATQPAKKKESVARFAQNNVRLAKLEARMMEMVNAERKKAGLVPLALDEDLADCARAHSLEMRDLDYFAHESPTPELRHPLDRYRLAIGDTPRIVAENVFRSWGSPREIGQKEMEDAHRSLMNSPGHRANILMPKITRIGIGFIANQNGDLWVTQMFSRP